jgi:hypothetical protein
MDAADQSVAKGTGSKRSNEHWLEAPAESAYEMAATSNPLERLRICELGPEAEQLSANILLGRVLPFLEQKLPDTAQVLFGRSSVLKDMNMTFAPGEPAVNRYTSGGLMKVHTDNYHVTINILLSDPGAFVGGGTAFWEQHPPDSSMPEEDPAAVLRPRQGSGAFFNGSVRHAGQVVTSGTRHLYVASFSLHPPDAGTTGFDEKDWTRWIGRDRLDEMD